jgi:hypothetical protein
LHYLDVFLPDRGGRFAQSECALGELQIFLQASSNIRSRPA